MRKKQLIPGLIGITLFFLVITVLYSIIIYTDGDDNVFAPFMPFIVLTGFFTFLIGAFLVAFTIFKLINKKDII